MNMKDRIRARLAGEAAAILSVKVTQEFEDAINLISRSAGLTLATGMGKARLVAKKFVATLSSTGTRAICIDPADAMHGDLGLVGEGDIIVVFSNSGATEEVLSFLAHARSIGLGKIVAVTMHRESALGQMADLVLEMGQISETCPHGLAPSASTTVMGAIGNAIAAELMELRGFSRQDFALRHPGGSLGRTAKLTPSSEAKRRSSSG